MSSIRRVIARDESARGGAPLPSPAALADDNLLDDDELDDVLELTEASETSMARRPIVDSHAKTRAAASSDAAELISPDSAEASRQSITALAAALAGERPAAPSHGATAADLTVNALVEAALRPMLKQWLDVNLPPLVERIVAAEIARITGGR